MLISTYIRHFIIRYPVTYMKRHYYRVPWMNGASWSSSNDCVLILSVSTSSLCRIHINYFQCPVLFCEDTQAWLSTGLVKRIGYRITAKSWIAKWIYVIVLLEHACVFTCYWVMRPLYDESCAILEQTHHKTNPWQYLKDILLYDWKLVYTYFSTH